MAKKITLNNYTTRSIILAIAKIGIITISCTSPYFLHAVVRGYLEEKRIEYIKRKARRLSELAKRKLISIEELPNNEVRITLTHQGKLLIRQYELEHMQITKPKKWDNYWRIIIYDIPTKRRAASNALRAKLKMLGLVQLQKSIWVTPYECIAEIEFLCTIFDIVIDKHIHYFKTKEIPKEKALREFFELKK